MLTLVKVGGSVTERSDPRPVMQVLREQARRRPLAVVPGGAEFAEAVRRADARFGLSDPAAHRMALLAMDQYGLLLADLAGGEPVSTVDAAVLTARGRRRLAVLLPSGVVLRSPLPASWQVTSDAVAAWLAGAAGATTLVLLKDVDGFTGPDGGVLRQVRASALTGVVDGAFADWLPPAVRCWILNGSVPARLTELLETGTTLGTEVTP